MKAIDFNTAYRELLIELVSTGYTEVNERTGVEIVALRGGHSFKVDVSSHIPMASNRKYFPHVAAAEVAWQFMGTKDPTFILKWAPKLWSKFVEDGELKTAYGWRWRHAFGRDQLAHAIYELTENPTNRQLFISAWDPGHDGLGGPQPKNIPCPVGFTLSREADNLHMSVLIRSSDVFVGLPYDVMCYCLTLRAIADQTGCRSGTITFTLAHPHLYEPHWAYVFKSLATWDNDQQYAEQTRLPGLWTIDDILENPDGHVKYVKSISVSRNPWNPLPEVIE